MVVSHSLVTACMHNPTAHYLGEVPARRGSTDMSKQDRYLSSFYYHLPFSQQVSWWYQQRHPSAFKANPRCTVRDPALGHQEHPDTQQSLSTSDLRAHGDSTGTQRFQPETAGMLCLVQT